MYYEVKRFGITLEWDTQYSKAKEAFDAAGTYGTVMYRIEGSKKYVIKTK